MEMQTFVVVVLVGLVAMIQGEDTGSCVETVDDGCSDTCTATTTTTTPAPAGTGEADSTTTTAAATTTTKAADDATNAETTEGTTEDPVDRRRRDVVQLVASCGDRNQTDCCMYSDCKWQTCNSGDQTRPVFAISLLMAVVVTLVGIL